MALVVAGCGSASSLIGSWGDADESTNENNGTASRDPADAGTVPMVDAMSDNSVGRDASADAPPEMPGQPMAEPPIECDPSRVLCNERCIDPWTNDLYCGASSDCRGENAGSFCGDESFCENLACRCTLGRIACAGECVEVELQPCGVAPGCEFDVVTDIGQTETLALSTNPGRRIAGNPLGDFWVGWKGPEDRLCIAHRAPERDRYADPQVLTVPEQGRTVLYDIVSNSVGGALALWTADRVLYASFFDADAGEFAAPMVIYDGPMTASIDAALLLDSGRALVAWVERDDNTDPVLGTLNLSQFDPETGAFSDPIVISEAQPRFNFEAKLGVDDSDTALVLWLEDPGPNIVNRTFSLQTASLGEKTRVTGLGELPSLAVNGHGQAVAAWTVNFNAEVAYSSTALGEWNTPVSFVVDGRPKTGIDAAGNAHVLLPGVAVIDYSAEAGEWGDLEYLDTGSSGARLIPSLALDPLGTAAAAFYVGLELFLARFDPAQKSWSQTRIAENPVPTSAFYQYPQIAAGQPGQFELAWDPISQPISAEPLPMHWVGVTHIE